MILLWTITKGTAMYRPLTFSMLWLTSIQRETRTIVSTGKKLITIRYKRCFKVKIQGLGIEQLFKESTVKRDLKYFTLKNGDMKNIRSH